MKRINQLLKDIQENGATKGIGKPKVLKIHFPGCYSRRIDDCNRLVYAVLPNGDIEIYQCKTHYGDK